MLAEEEQLLKENGDKFRRQEEQLIVLQSLVERWDAERDADRREGLQLELQADFDKYLRLYSRESEKLKRQRKKTAVGGRQD